MRRSVMSETGRSAIGRPSSPCLCSGRVDAEGEGDGVKIPWTAPVARHDMLFFSSLSFCCSMLLLLGYIYLPAGRKRYPSNRAFRDPTVPLGCRYATKFRRDWRGWTKTLSAFVTPPRHEAKAVDCC